MISRCSLDSQHGRADRHPANVGCSFLRYTNDNFGNHRNQRRKKQRIPLNHILRICTAGCKLSRSQEKIIHLMYVDDIKLFATNEKELETLIHAVKIYSHDKGMEFGIGKFSMLVMKSSKRHLTDGMELPNQDKVRMLREKET